MADYTAQVPIDYACMSDSPRPPLDPIAAQRWQELPLAQSPWLHEEVGRRMAERLQWLRERPQRWWHWQALNGGLQTHLAVQAQLPGSAATVHESTPERLARAAKALTPTVSGLQKLKQSFQRLGRSGAAPITGTTTPTLLAPDGGSMDMVWANMALHSTTDPQALLHRWREALKVDGIVMFSCLGPDSLRELHQLYQALGWPPASQAFTDMHDWGDMLIEAGFSEPVMDVERITLAYTTLPPLLRDLREWGRNLHPARSRQVPPKAWQRDLEAALQQAIAQPGGSGQFQLSFEVIYGHAIKPPPRVAVASTSQISLSDMRTLLGQGKR